VLDNAASVGQVRPLLPGTASCLALVTSRSRLAGLAVRDGAHRLGLDVLPERESILLLRTFTAEYRREDDPVELAELARLCARLPLALRIAAERAAGRPRMPLSELIADLRDESSLWDALSTENDEEADTVRTVFAWSYRALPPDAARLFRVLGLHPSPEFDISAAAALAGATAGRVRHLLDALVGAHMLEQIGPTRYQFHDLLRAYATDQAHHEESEQDQHAALHRVFTWYLHTGQAAKDTITPGGIVLPIDLEPLGDGVEVSTFADYDLAVDWYETERTNLIAAVHGAVEAGFDRIAWQIPSVLARIYTNRDPVNVWLSTEQIALTAVRRLADRYGEAVILDNLGIRFRVSNRLGEAADRHRLALAIFRDIPDQFGEARSFEWPRPCLSHRTQVCGGQGSLRADVGHRASNRPSFPDRDLAVQPGRDQFRSWPPRRGRGLLFVKRHRPFMRSVSRWRNHRHCGPLVRFSGSAGDSSPLATPSNGPSSSLAITTIRSTRASRCSNSVAYRLTKDFRRRRLPQANTRRPSRGSSVAMTTRRERWMLLAKPTGSWDVWTRLSLSIGRR
jgi:hypothetical protein